MPDGRTPRASIGATFVKTLENSPPFEGGVRRKARGGYTFIIVVEQSACNHPVREARTPLLQKEGSFLGFELSYRLSTKYVNQEKN